MNNTENDREILLEVKNLSYRYDDHKYALNNISVQIAKGEKIAVLGCNGAGKSTFFLNLNGVLHAQEGQILFQGKEITGKNLNELRKHVGFVFQDADNQIIASTVMAEVSFGPMNLKLPKEEVKKRVMDALYYMDLTDYKDRPPHYLSGGEKKRVSIADIIAMEPEILLFDEPTASLDPANVEMLEGVLAKLIQEEKTLLISTHDIDFAYRFADRIMVFYNSELIADGKPLDIFRQEDILQKAHLKKPSLLAVHEQLAAAHMVGEDTIPPKTMEEFGQLVKTC